MKKKCPECEEGLCIECEKSHRRFKLSRHHKVISIGFKGATASLPQTSYRCEVHETEFKMYCPQHDQPCCPSCISNEHKICNGLVSIADFVSNANTTQLMEDIEQSLLDSKNDIETIITDREQNLSKIKLQRNQVQNKIKQIRDQINLQEKKLLKDLDDAEEFVSSQIGKALSQLREKGELVKQLQHNLTEVKSKDSVLQAFLEYKKLAKQADKENKYIRSLSNDETFHSIELHHIIDDKFADTAAVSVFGTVAVKKVPTTVALQTEKYKQAQIISDMSMHSGSIDDIKLILIRTFDLPKGKDATRLMGCSMFQQSKIEFVDCHYNARIVITNDHGILRHDFPVSPSIPFDVTCLDKSSIAFTSLNDNKIQILNTISQTTNKTIKTSATCHGITNSQGTLIYNERGIILNQVDTGSSNTVVHENFPTHTYVVSNEKYIYHTNNTSNTVTCYNLRGVKAWEFKDTSILKKPYGVAVDKHLNVYVASNGNNSITVISPDGRKSRQILKREDGIKNPWALAIDKQTGSLLVTGLFGEIFLYDIFYDKKR